MPDEQAEKAALEGCDPPVGESGRLRAAQRRGELPFFNRQREHEVVWDLRFDSRRLHQKAPRGSNVARTSPGVWLWKAGVLRPAAALTRPRVAAPPSDRRFRRRLVARGCRRRWSRGRWDGRPSWWKRTRPEPLLFMPRPNISEVRSA